MKLYAPSYYRSFTCIADRCKHSCCVGWEIDIDEKSLERFAQVKGELGQRLKANIADGHFVLDEKERCPFLNKKGLCDLIIGLGEGCLCQVCDDHPRFRTFFSDRTEVGLGLCCEAAGALILGREEPMILVAQEGEEALDEEELAFLETREKLFTIAQNRQLPFAERFSRLKGLCGFCEMTPGYWQKVYRGLERLDPVWDSTLDTLNGEAAAAPLPDTVWEQLLVYFLYRHLYNGPLGEQLAFCLLSVQMIQWLYLKGGQSGLQALVEIARQYSAEIEYSDENIDELVFCERGTF